MPDVQLFGATGLDEVRSAFAQADIDHVVMGAGGHQVDQALPPSRLHHLRT
jgi:hypothetical protein